MLILVNYNPKGERISMKRIYNFNPGPATLPLEVLETVTKEMTNYKDSGMSITEISHRSDLYQEMHDQTKADLKDLMKLDDDKEIVFIQGGATLQFTMVPLNLLMPEDKMMVLNTGSWTKKAYAEAKKFARAEYLDSSEDQAFSYVPKIDQSKITDDTRYLHICTNNTIYGTRVKPENLEGIEVPLVADMSSNIMSEVYNYNLFDIFYAGAQKNLGPAGVTLVVLKKDIIKETRTLPVYLEYKTFLEKDSLYNTPPVFAIYVVGLVAKWLKAQGGIEAMEEINKKKAKLIYDFIDNSKIFNNNINPEDRSLMNVVFVTGKDQLDAEFVKGALDRGLGGLKGHRSVGGMRASLYNAMPYEGVEALVDYMKEFESKWA